ncbi:MAG: hypothetical protein EAX95_13215 [Candidatus Thorarchaeota archaeon]|nr:hypothetical protein [Candidatus Thorarchaeota archaeon]
MAGQLKVHEFMVLLPGGVPIFHYSQDDSRKLDELLSGFLAAITSFASEFGEKTVQSLSFEGSELLYEQGETGALLILLVDTEAPSNVLRAVLRDLSRKFHAEYQQHMELELPTEEAYAEFREEVERAFSFYEGILVITSSLSAFVVPTIKEGAFRLASDSGGLIDEFHRDFGNNGTRVLAAIDGRTPIYEISEQLGIEEEEVLDVVEYLAIWGIMKISKMCPRIGKADARFDAFLDLIGLPRKDYQLLTRAVSLCTGSRAMAEISEKLGVTSERLYEVLRKLGDEVEWEFVEVRGLATS